jgi:FLVCR family MFS transporter 7
MFSINMGLESSIVALLNPIMLPYGYTNEQAGIAGFVRLFSGFLAGAVTGPLIDRTGQHMLILRLFVPALAFTYVMMYIQSKLIELIQHYGRPTNLVLVIPSAILVVCMACVLNGFVTLLLLPTMLEIASESELHIDVVFQQTLTFLLTNCTTTIVTYPVSESLSTSVLWAAAEIASFVMTLVMDLMKSGSDTTPPNNMKNALLFAMILACVGALPIAFFKGKMRRLAQDINFAQVALKDEDAMED